MKTLILSLFLLVGFVGVCQAAPGGGGWTVTIMTGTALSIGAAGRPTFLKRIGLSSGTTLSLGSYVVAYSTPPSVENGAGVTLIPHTLFAATAAVTVPIIFRTTTTAVSPDASLVNSWTVGDCNDCYIQVSAPTSATASGNQGQLHLRKTDEASGGAFQVEVHWSH